MAAQIQAHYPDAEVRLVQGGGGRFEVSIDGRLVFSKKKLGRHAERGEVLAIIQGLQR